MKRTTVCIILASVLLPFAATSGQTPQGPTLPQGFGISAKYPDDRGIAKDRSVIWSEDFESGSILQITKRVSEVKNPRNQVLKLSTDTPQNGADQHALQITATLGKDNGGHLYKKLPRGLDQAFARFYVKFEKDPGYIHHFVTLGGYHPATQWPQGGAGTRPKGDQRFTAGIEPYGNWGKLPPPGQWNFYTYWHEMKVSAGNKYWGNGLRPAQPQKVPAGQWQCVEVMIKCNTPGKRDGQLALWLDGKLVAHFYKGAPRGRWTGMGFDLKNSGGEPFEGFSWRTTNKLKVNFFWLLHYVTDSSARRNKDKKRSNTVLFDQIVVASEYIGPIKMK